MSDVILAVFMAVCICTTVFIFLVTSAALVAVYRCCDVPDPSENKAIV